MKKCTKCNVSVQTDRKTCPLCFSVLESDNNNDYEKLYPSYSKKIQNNNLFLRIVAFICVVSVLITFIINISTYNEETKLWFLYVLVSMAYIFILFRSAIISRGNVAKKLVVQMITISITIWIINYLSDYNIRWSIDYVIPSLAIVSGTTILILLFAKRVRYSEYILYMFAQMLIGIIPFILWLFKVVDVLWPSLSAACFSLVMLLGMIFFANSETKEEFKKRFHI